MAGITSSHHVLGIKHLLGELGHRKSPVLLAPPAGERGKARHEEMQTGERHHVDCQFAQISVELTREAQTGGDPAHCGRHEVVKITVGGCSEFECTEANIIQRLIVDAIRFISVLHQLMDGQRGIVRLYNSV